MSPEELVKDIDKLVSLPEVFIQVNQMMEQPSCSSAKLADIISADTDISARLLRLVNSPFYGLRSNVDTISRAVTIAGTQELRNLVSATIAVRSFTGIPENLVNMDEFWRHGVTTGVMAQMLAKYSNVLHSERLFVAGMLHDVGRLAIYLTIPEKAIEIMEITGGDEWILAEVEERILGFNHMDVGAALMKSWQLPDSLISVAQNHHTPSYATTFQLDVAIVHIALAIARGEMSGFPVDEMLWAIEPNVWDATGLSPERVSPHVVEMLRTSLDTMGMILAPTDLKRA
ncbi:MAG: HDOD domain-containing protein [Candidatus Thiodiazotropha sp. (ex Myrtea sp. 'scaly one' KF741663)]|nr:HDOD domain-containing protein [Candidatus Thiodiazotropha sp. (ex Myrtea sp. 'scaly one' KF741663)]